MKDGREKKKRRLRESKKNNLICVITNCPQKRMTDKKERKKEILMIMMCLVMAIGIYIQNVGSIIMNNNRSAIINIKKKLIVTQITF